MIRVTVLMSAVTAVLGIGVSPVAGQMNGPAVQNGPHAIVSHPTRATSAHAARPTSPTFTSAPVNVVHRPMSSQLPGFHPYAAVNARPNYSPFTRSVNPTLAAMRARRNARLHDLLSSRRRLASNEFTHSHVPFAVNPIER